ncbi:MAG TPA: 2Fe-2S iron-sulfur cluster-binding protein [Gemmatimonadaceae bacterium]|nr:2Fe-2S iron-sulfur cluster-binding protein [Gemmatimonadaceae bacterium]
MTSRALTVTIDGRRVSVAAGASVAVALLDADVVRFRRSVRGEPRGPVCGMGICYECRVTIDGAAHQRACLVDCEEGMVIETGAPPRD